eukprot:757927-Hanusia_phi.AAC.5
MCLGRPAYPFYPQPSSPLPRFSSPKCMEENRDKNKRETGAGCPCSSSDHDLPRIKERIVFPRVRSSYNTVIPRPASPPQAARPAVLSQARGESRLRVLSDP